FCRRRLCLPRWRRRGWRFLLRHHPWRHSLLHLLWRRLLNREVLCDSNVIALPFHYLIDQVLLFFLLNGITRLVLGGLWRAERIRGAATRSNQNMSRVYLFVR